MRYRAEGLAYVLFTLIVGLPASALGYYGRGSGAALVLGGAYLVIVVWLRTFEIVLADDHLEFKSLFGGRRRMEYRDIEVVCLTYEPDSGFAGPYRLRVLPKAGSGRQPFFINAKMFSREALKAVLDTAARVARADDGELLDGVAIRTYRQWKRRRAGNSTKP